MNQDHNRVHDLGVGTTAEPTRQERRRQRARLGGVGVGAVALVAALAFGIVQLAPGQADAAGTGGSQQDTQQDTRQGTEQAGAGSTAAPVGEVSAEPTEPASEQETDPAGDCSATGITPLHPTGNAPHDGAAAAAASIVTAASACDEDALVALAADSTTELMFGLETPEQTFVLPEAEHRDHYRTLVTLLGSTRSAVAGGPADNPTVVWPRVATEEFRDDDAAWQEVVDAGLLTQEDAAAQRADETFGYTGMVVGIAANGSWRYYSSTD